MKPESITLAGLILDGIGTMAKILAKLINGGDPTELRNQLETEGVVISSEPTDTAITEAESHYPE